MEGGLLDGCRALSKYDWRRRSCRKTCFKKLNQSPFFFFSFKKNLPSLPCLAFHHEIKNEHKRRAGSEKLLQLSLSMEMFLSLACGERLRQEGF